MANICDWRMLIKGNNRDDINTLYSYLASKSIFKINEKTGERTLDKCIYRGDDGVEIPVKHHFFGVGYEGYVEKGDEFQHNSSFYLECCGTCKWSVNDCFLYPSSDNILTIDMFKATADLNLMVEIFSKESGLQLAEHYIIQNGKMLKSEVKNYKRFFLEMFDSKEEAEKEIGMPISSKQWKNQDKIEVGYFDEEFGII